MTTRTSSRIHYDSLCTLEFLLKSRSESLNRTPVPVKFSVSFLFMSPTAISHLPLTCIQIYLQKIRIILHEFDLNNKVSYKLNSRLIDLHGNVSAYYYA